MVGVERSKPEPDNVPNGASRDTDEEPTYAKESPEEDYGWLRSVVENSSEIVTIVDVDGTLRYASPAFGRVLGHDPEEAIGTMNVLDHVHLDDLPHVLEETKEALSKGGVATNKAEYRFRHRDGSWRHFECTYKNLSDNPAVGGILLNARDITESTLAEQSLRRSEAKYRMLPLTDVMMPRMNGRQLAPAAAELRPDLRVLYMSGYTDDAVLRRGLLNPDLPFIRKPFTPEALEAKVREVLDS